LLSKDHYKWLKIDAPPDEGGYFRNLSKYFDLKGTNDLLEIVEPWTAKQYPELAKWLKANDKPLALAFEASKRPRFYDPIVDRRADGRPGFLWSVHLSGAQKSIELANALALRAMLRVGEKKYDDAWQDLLACHRLGRLVAQGGTLTEGFGVAVDRIASDSELAFLEHAKLDREQIQKCLADLQKLPPMPSMADKFGLTERFLFPQAVMVADRDGVELGYAPGGSGFLSFPSGPARPFPDSTNWDAALRKGNQFYDRMEATLRLKDRTFREKRLREVEKDIKDLKASIDFDKAVTDAKISHAKITGYLGDTFICTLLPAASKVQHAADGAEQTQNNLHIAFALAAYRADNKQYPKNLDALAPKYLPSVPADLFSGKALIYRPEANGYLLYSIGPNGKDDSGVNQFDDPPKDDIAVRMPRKK
jgi:hypothetical protein